MGPCGSCIYLMILRQPVAVGLYEVVHKAADLIDGQFAPGMGVQHGGLIDVLLLPGESGIYGELVHLDLPPIQRRRADWEAAPCGRGRD